MIFSSFPLPPSVNEYLMPSRGRLIKTAVHRAYQTECLVWRMKNPHIISLVIEKIAKEKERRKTLGIPLMLKVDTQFAFHRSRLFNKKGEPKSLDANNRIKPILDALVDIIDVDDKYFFEGSYSKVPLAEHLPEYALIQISFV